MPTALDLYTRHADLPPRLAGAMTRRRDLADDIHQYARLGLWRAARTFDPDQIPADADPDDYFRGRAVSIIRWEIAEGLRALDPLRRTGRAKVRALHHSYEHLAARHGREPTWLELADDLGPDQLHQAVAAERATHPRSVDDLVIDLHDPAATDPAAAAIGDDLRRRLDAAVAALPPDLAVTLELRYHYDLTQTQVADVLGITGSAVCQRERRAYTLLRDTLTTWERTAA